MTDETYVYLQVVGFDDDPRTVTALIGLEPSEAYRTGDVHVLPNGKERLRNASMWSLRCSLPTSADVEDQLEALLDVLEPHADGVRAAAERYEAVLSCAVYYADFTPGIHLSDDLVRRVAALGLSIDFDLYFLGEDDDA